MKISSLVDFLRTPDLSSKLALMNDLKTLSRIQFLYAAVDTGLLKILRLPASRDELARRINAKRPDLLEALLELGVAIGELYRRDGMYGLRGKRAAALARESNDPFAAYLQEAVSYHGSVYLKLAQRIAGAPSGDYLNDTADLIARSSRTLEPLLRGFVRDLVTTTKPKRLLEIGCGSGAYLRHASDAYSGLTGVGIDMQEAAVLQARQNLSGWGVSERFTVKKADIRVQDNDLGGPFDLITLYNNLYYFPQEERTGLFARIRQLLTPGGTVAVVSIMRGESVSSRNFDVVLQSTKGCAPLPGVSETVEQMRAAGFNKFEVKQILASEHFAGVLAQN